MKKPNKFIILLLSVFFLMQHYTSVAQEDTAAAEPVVKLHYFNDNNSVQYLVLESSLKKNKKFTPQANKAYQLYLDNSNAESLIAKVQTDKNGKADAFIPTSLKAAWDATPQHTFIVKAGDEEVISDYAITKAKITLDTATTDGVRNITATVTKLDKNGWVPAADVELVVGIQRLGSILSAGAAATYTTDSTGKVTVELKRDSLPGDENGNYILAARADDNETLGNLLVQKAAPWGVVTIPDNNFFNLRTLWTTRFHAPYWLLGMAYSIGLGIWITIIFLIVQLVKIKRLGVKFIEESGEGKGIKK
jgi:5-hydroxyisourate hydrolase-like protein (transthyretin family)